MIVEGFVEFDYEITHHGSPWGGTSFCDPIGHVQVDGDTASLWQPMSDAAKKKYEIC